MKLDRGDDRSVIRVIDLELCTAKPDVEVAHAGTPNFKPPCKCWCFAGDVYGAMRTLVALVCPIILSLSSCVCACVRLLRAVMWCLLVVLQLNQTFDPRPPPFLKYNLGRWTCSVLS